MKKFILIFVLINGILISNAFGSYDDYQYSYYDEPACGDDGICLTFQLSEDAKTFKTFVTKQNDSTFNESGTASLYWRDEISLVELVEFEAGTSQINFDFNDPIMKGHSGRGSYFVKIITAADQYFLTERIYMDVNYLTSCSTEFDGGDVNIWWSSTSGTSVKNYLSYYVPDGVGYWTFYTEKKEGYLISVNCPYENFDTTYQCKYEELEDTYRFTAATGFDLVVKYEPQFFIISGNITSEGNVGIGNVDITGFPNTPDTDYNGYYETTVPYGWSGTVYPEIWGYTFVPQSITYSNVTSDMAQNYSIIEENKACLSLPPKYINQNETGTFGLDLVNNISVKEGTIEFTYDAAAGFDIVEITLTKRMDNFSASFSKDENDLQNVIVKSQFTSNEGNYIEPGSGDIITFIYTTNPDANENILLQFTENNVLKNKDNEDIQLKKEQGTFTFYQEQDTDQTIKIQSTIIAHEFHSSMKIAGYGDYVYLLVDSQKNSLAKFYVSKDQGKSFDSGRIIGSEVKYIELKVGSNGHIHIFWDNFARNLNYMKSTDNGISFSKTRVLNKENTEYKSGTDYNCFIDQYNNIYFIFQHSSGQKRDISFIKSEDDGETFSEPVQVTYNEIQEDQPKIIAFNGIIYITYWDLSSQNIYLMNSSDNFAKQQIVNKNSVESSGYDFAINKYGYLLIPYSAIVGDDIELLMARSLDKGESFDHSLITSSSIREQTYPQIYTFNNAIHLSWTDRRNNNADIYYTRSIDNGDSYEVDINVSQQLEYQSGSDIIADNFRVYIIASNQNDTPYSTDLYTLTLLDKTPPKIHIKTPTNLSNPNNLTKITGTAKDEISGIYEVKIQVFDGKKYWNSNNHQWQQQEIWLECEGTESWIFDKSIQWSENVSSYTITAKATDPSENAAYTSINLILPKSNITCNISDEKIIVGESVYVNGEIYFENKELSLGNQNIKIILNNTNDNSIKEFSVQTDSNGHYLQKISCSEINASGIWSISAKINGNTNFIGSDSLTKHLSVEKAIPKLLLETSIQRVKYNQTIKINGQIKPEIYDFPGCNNNIPVILEIKHENSEPYFLTAITYNSYGQFREEYTFDKLGKWFLTAHFAGNDGYYTTTTQNLNIEVVENVGYAIIIQGKSPNNEGILSHEKTTDYVYKQLRNRGFGHDDIYYLKYNSNTNNEQSIEVDGVPTKEKVQDAITQWAKDKMEANPGNLYLVMVDHGLNNNFVIVNDETDIRDAITSDELSSWLNTLQNSFETQDAKDQKIIVILGFCYSGSFINNISGDNRIIITSAAHDEQSYKGPKDQDDIRQGEFFVAELFYQIGLGKSLYNAFITATNSTEIFTTSNNTPFHPTYSDYAPQHPLLDDNGDKKGSNQLNELGGDGDISNKIVIGAASSETNALMDASIIKVPDTIILDSNTTSVELWAEVDMPENVLAIWVEIKKADFSITAQSESEQITMALEKYYGEIISETNHAQWNNLIDVFQGSGLYRAYYFIKDSKTGNVSQIKQTKIYKKKKPDENQPPNDFNLVYPKNDSLDQRTNLFLIWEKTQDPDGDKIEYTVILSKDNQNFLPDDNNLIKKQGIDSNSCFVKLPERWDLSTVYWKVQAIDAFGAVTESEVWNFKPDDKNLITLCLEVEARSICNNNILEINDSNVSVTGKTNDFQIPYFCSPTKNPETLNENWEIIIKYKGYHHISNKVTVKQPVNGIFSKYNAKLTPLANIDCKIGLKNAILLLLKIIAEKNNLTQININEIDKINLDDVIYVLQQVAGIKQITSCKNFHD